MKVPFRQPLAKLKGTSLLACGTSPAIMHPSLFKVPLTVSYWSLAVYPMGKHALISKGDTCGLAAVVAAVRASVSCSYCEGVSLFI